MKHYNNHLYLVHCTISFLNPHHNIRSAFLKGNTKEHLLLFYADENLARSVAGSITVDYTQYHKRWENICPKKKLSRPCTNSLHYGKIAVQIQCYR